jgi:hypothetical protein
MVGAGVRESEGRHVAHERPDMAEVLPIRPICIHRYGRFTDGARRANGRG